jgi:hypothetical protein
VGYLFLLIHKSFLLNQVQSFLLLCIQYVLSMA